jgi:DNA-binding transcriptional LysR family regulator
VLARLAPEYPDIHLEVAVDQGLTDIVSERFDAGVRLGEHLAKDMVAVRIGPDLRMVVVGSPSYFAGRPAPQTPHDLTAHNCINIRLASHGGLYVWEFAKDGRELKVRVEGQMILNTGALRLKAALAGMGLAYLMEDLVAEHVAEGRPVPVLTDWSPPFPGYTLFTPGAENPWAK